MNKCFQTIFTIPGTFRDEDYQLKFDGISDDNGDWINGELVTDIQSPRAGRIESGVAYFVGREYDGWGTDEDLNRRSWSHKMSPSELIWRNLLDRKLESLAGDEKRTAFFREINALTDGLTMEVAIGPGGGYFPYMLKIAPGKKMLANDIGGWIVREWKRASVNYGLGESLSFAQFDVKYAPVRSNCLDCVLCAGGMSSIPGLTIALSEIYRMLKPGGVFFMVDGSISEKAFGGLSETGKIELQRRFPDAKMEYVSNRIRQVGFGDISSRVTGHGVSRPEEGLWGQFGAKYGIVFEKDYYSITARK